VLAAYHWPPYNLREVELPPCLLQCRDAFTEFYAGRERKLSWAYGVGCAVGVARFDHGVRDVQCSLLQALVLLAVCATDDGCTGEYVVAATGLAWAEVAPILQTLLLPTLAIARRADASRQNAISKHETFAMNVAVDTQRIPRKCRLPETTVKAASGAPEQGRTYDVEAAIVGEMKRYQRLSFAELWTMLNTRFSGRFDVEQRFLKKCVENLIEREYLHRDFDDPSALVYVA
jgi:hypothetical protein